MFGVLLNTILLHTCPIHVIFKSLKDQLIRYSVFLAIYFTLFVAYMAIKMVIPKSTFFTLYGIIAAIIVSSFVFLRDIALSSMIAPLVIVIVVSLIQFIISLACNFCSKMMMIQISIAKIFRKLHFIITFIFPLIMILITQVILIYISFINMEGQLFLYLMVLILGSVYILWSFAAVLHAIRVYNTSIMVLSWSDKNTGATILLASMKNTFLCSGSILKAGLLDSIIGYATKYHRRMDTSDYLTGAGGRLFLLFLLLSMLSNIIVYCFNSISVCFNELCLTFMTCNGDNYVESMQKSFGYTENDYLGIMDFASFHGIIRAFTGAAIASLIFPVFYIWEYKSSYFKNMEFLFLIRYMPEDICILDIIFKIIIIYIISRCFNMLITSTAYSLIYMFMVKPKKTIKKFPELRRVFRYEK